MPLIRDYSYPKFKRLLVSIASLGMAFVFLNLTMGCYYYKMRTKTSALPEEVTGLQDREKVFILDDYFQAWQYSDLEFKGDTLYGKISGLNDLQQTYLTKKRNNSMRYKKADMAIVLNEVHIFSSNITLTKGDSLELIASIHISDIDKVEIYDKDVGKTTASFVFSTIGVVVGAFIIIMILAVLIKGSCPFIYTFDGTAYHFRGELFGGAVYSSLERDDFMPLPGWCPVEDKYILKISNKLLERSHINLAELIIIEHPENTHALIDRHGNMHTVNNPQPAYSAYSDNHSDYTQSLEIIDNDLYIFNDESISYTPGQGQFELSSIELSFEKPENVKAGKLLIHAKNSLWGDYIYNEFTKYFGADYSKWIRKQKDVPAQENIDWMIDQGLPLLVYVETGDGWQFADYDNVVGPLGSRDMVMSLDISEVTSEVLNIKLESGFLFWELDYVAIDYSEDIEVDVVKLSPASGFDHNYKEVSSLLSYDDSRYLKQFDVGDEAIITYDVPLFNPSLTQTVYMHSKGYYEHIRDYQGRADVETLETFRKPGKLSAFSRERYHELSTRTGITAILNDHPDDK